MSAELLTSGLSVGIKLHSIESPNGGTSETVTLEPRSQERQLGESTRTLILIRQAPSWGRPSGPD